eukprot:CAMPEP_0204570210 /NCGR_PEP_ID=MMETSP0661-20131031/38185_1 /ASSEMBLY_ACC=CAM_ASM_000606 /TAXON_ID=109239 /ORGANISM="Alexandrium margalefi, Strain AMGDE01CS-322" /LENGTH=287 /DNA_ID=CAMNT_0051578381 /DNA_START=57 /DNA_END=914 /DNA_ORIENTATION=-
MSRDHKPTLKSERKRIALAGGFVTAEGRVDGNLNLSRALGDFAYKKDASRKPTEQKISGEAEVRCKPLTELDRYLLLGCDGIFEKVTSQELVDFILPRLRSQRRSWSPAPLSAACSAFLDENVAKNPAKEQGMGCDNMTLMLVDLQADSSPAALGRMAGSVAGGKAAAASHYKVNGGSPRRKGPRTQRLITKDGGAAHRALPGPAAPAAHATQVAARRLAGHCGGWGPRGCLTWLLDKCSDARYKLGDQGGPACEKGASCGLDLRGRELWSGLRKGGILRALTSEGA